jgi:hypothetical protein
MIVSSRGNLVPTYSTGRVISSALSYVRFPSLREKDRILIYFINGADLRSAGTPATRDASRDLLLGFHINLWPNKPEMDVSQAKNFNFLDGAFRAAKIFSILFARKSISAYNLQFLTRFISFVPKKTRSRKKNIFEALCIRVPPCSYADFFFFWRIYFYFPFLARAKEELVDSRSVSSSKAMVKISDLSGLYFLGADVFNLENYFLSFKIFVSSEEYNGNFFPALSTPKCLRSDFSRKVRGLVSRFRFLSLN